MFISSQEMFYVIPDRYVPAMTNTRLNLPCVATAVVQAAMFSVLCLTLLAWAIDENAERKLRFRREAFHFDSFPDNFEWGVATSSYQIEGGAYADGKGVGIWDEFTKLNPSPIVDGSNGDVAADSYHKYDKDIDLIANQLGAKVYRFSIAWSRILPDGTTNTINQKGIDFYNRLINGLLTRDIKPIATLYHWDLPNALQEKYGGWTNSSIVEDFANYADLCFREFGDRVKQWITINEPRIVAVEGFESGTMAPGIKSHGTLVYTTSKHLLLAHAKSYHVYNEKYRKHQKGKIGLALNCDWGEPKNPNSPDDIAATDRFLQFQLGLYAHPIYQGDWPAVLKTNIAEKSAAEGLSSSRLPDFTPYQIKYVKGTADFFGLNTYTSRIISDRPANPKVVPKPGFYSDEDMIAETDPAWKKAASSWLYLTPFAIEKMLVWIKHSYPTYTEIYITENGMSNPPMDPVQLCDPVRYNHLLNTTNYLLKAITNDGVKVSGYMHWSLLDNFEWSRGYQEKFGLYYVDFDDKDRPRYPKASALVYRELIKANGFPGRLEIEKWKTEAEHQCRRLNLKLRNGFPSTKLSSIMFLSIFIAMFFLL